MSHFARGSLSDQPSLTKQKTMRAEFKHIFGGVAHEKHRYAGVSNLLDPTEAFFLELGVSDSKNLV